MEDRRERPERYLAEFKARADAQRESLKEEKNKKYLKEFTLSSMLDHFRGIYRANYHHQDAWKIGMHLSEEIGEATIELSRIELRWLAQKANFDVGRRELEKIFVIAKKKISEQTANIKKQRTRNERSSQLEGDLKELQAEIRSDPWRVYGGLVTDKFKEEIADVFSWIAAIIVKLDPETRRFRKFPDRFVRTGVGGVTYLSCPWCHEYRCNDSV